MKITTPLSAAIAVAFLALSHAASAQEGEEPLYLTVDCMKSTTPDYTSVERDTWQPMHQELVKRGKRNSWALYAVLFGDRSRCDYYTVTSFRGQEQLNADPGYEEVFEAVHKGRDVAKAMAKTLASREHVFTELWIQIDSTDIGAHRYAIVNLMQADDPDAYERMESRVFKAGHETLIEAGQRAGWTVNALVSPGGSQIPYNYSTVDFTNHLNPVPMAEALIAANPDRDLRAMHDLLRLREHVRSETWTLVTATELPAVE